MLLDEAKTLMFFEGCPPQLGCSIKLRGASEYELARVKEIIRLMVCVAYHSQLEISFLMDEFAMPPSLAQGASFPCLLDGGSADAGGSGEETEGENQERPVESSLGERPEEEGHASESSSKEGDMYSLSNKHTPKLLPRAGEEAVVPETMTSLPFPSSPAPSLSVPPPFLMEDDEEMASDALLRAPVGETGEEESLENEDSLIIDNGDGSEMPTPRRFRDPLQDDTVMFVAVQVASSDDHLKAISCIFKQELKDIILCISPFITFKKPFLLTPAGMHCPSRDYFPEQVPVPLPQTHHICPKSKGISAELS